MGDRQWIHQWHIDDFVALVVKGTIVEQVTVEAGQSRVPHRLPLQHSMNVTMQYQVPIGTIDIMSMTVVLWEYWALPPSNSARRVGWWVTVDGMPTARRILKVSQAEEQGIEKF